MSIFLAGAGPDHRAFPQVFDRFALAVRRCSGDEAPSRVAVVVHDRNGNPESLLPAYVDPLLARMPVEVVPVLLGAG
ncbi:MAG: hypothetical protein C0488_15410, partial [Arthrobacter sp.]|nr:hypothetical protein [Arthrobacter sp.]